MAKPEKLNLWDRFFNRYRKELIATSYKRVYRPAFYDVYEGLAYPATTIDIKIGLFKKTDRLTGSETFVEDAI